MEITFVGILETMTRSLLYLFIPELVFIIFVEKTSNKRFKFRFSKSSGNSNLKPFAKFWKIGVVLFLIYILFQIISENVLEEQLQTWFNTLNENIWPLTIALSLFSLIVIIYHGMQKCWDKLATLLSIGTVVFFIIFLHLAKYLTIVTEST